MPPPSTLARLHRWIGWTTLVVFLLTGHYMRNIHQPPMEELEPGLRMLLRSRHIYLLFTGLLNLLAATRAEIGRPRWLGITASGLLMLSPVVLLAAFVVETVAFQVPTPLSIYGVQAALAGVLGRLLAVRLSPSP